MKMGARKNKGRNQIPAFVVLNFGEQQITVMRVSYLLQVWP